MLKFVPQDLFSQNVLMTILLVFNAGNKVFLLMESQELSAPIVMVRLLSYLLELKSVFKAQHSPNVLMII